MTVRDLIRILVEYADYYGENTYVVLATQDEEIGDAEAVGMSADGDICIQANV